jgi:hypothetical protein
VDEKRADEQPVIICPMAIKARRAIIWFRKEEFIVFIRI